MSKANQAFKHNDEAVSPVIGVILMVAITVVLAAVVFVLVSNLGGDSNTAPAISWNKNESQDTLSVVTASSNADWANLEISCEPSGGALVPASLDIELNGAAADAGTAGTLACDGTPDAIEDAAAAIRAGDELYFCGTAMTDLGSVEITITDPTANQIVKEESFTVEAC